MWGNVKRIDLKNGFIHGNLAGEPLGIIMRERPIEIDWKCATRSNDYTIKEYYDAN